LSRQQMTLRRMGSAALSLAYTACGRFDGFWAESLKPWDAAGGVALVLEAGGTVTTPELQPYDVYLPTILATNGLLHAAFGERIAAVGPSR
ncbi:MAG: inositol monophosphatase family protein, partial [Planctomycetia bacterium]